MFYSFNVDVPPDTDEDSAEDTPLEVSAGIIHQVDLVFPTNANREIYLRIFAGSYQFIPVNPRGAVRANNTIISTREFLTLHDWNNTLTLRAWNVHATETFTVGINIGILPKRILQPFSFEELLRVALAAEGEEIET